MKQENIECSFFMWVIQDYEEIIISFQIEGLDVGEIELSVEEEVMWMSSW